VLPDGRRSTSLGDVIRLALELGVTDVARVLAELGFVRVVEVPVPPGPEDSTGRPA
jgi:hypothetical protein